jgi:hypothetical protein
MSTIKHIHGAVSGGPYRAVVKYSNSVSGQVRVVVPAVLGKSEVALSLFGRSLTASGWAVPVVGDQILVGTDDNTFSNVFWIQTDGTSKLEERVAILETKVTQLMEAMQ